VFRAPAPSVDAAVRGQRVTLPYSHLPAFFLEEVDELASDLTAYRVETRYRSFFDELLMDR
jgi:hypothetical protein